MPSEFSSRLNGIVVPMIFINRERVAESSRGDGTSQFGSMVLDDSLSMTTNNLGNEFPEACVGIPQ